MNFYYFRILVAILASQGALFAYLCRLNLSLALKEMVVPEPMRPNELETGPNAEHGRKLFNSRNEDEAISTLSHLRARSLTLSKMRARKLSESGFNPTMRNISLAPLAITTESTVLPRNTSTFPRADGEVEIRVADNKLNWNEDARNNLLGAFFIGYSALQIPGGRGAEIFGSKTMFLFMGLGTGLMSLIFPFVAKCSDSIVYAYISRIIMGASQGVLFPASYVFLCEWLPPNERSKWLSIPSTLGRVGTIIMYLVVPIILRNYDWEAVFYMSGSITLVWTLMFFVFASNRPYTSYWISDKELLYIESKMEPNQADLKQQSSISASGFTINEPAEKPRINWFKIIKNKPLQVLALVMFTSEWSNMLLLVKLPGFLGPALKMELEEISFWSIMLIIVYCVQYPLSNYIAARLEISLNSDGQSDGTVSLRIRKIFEALAQAMQATGCLLVAFFQKRAIVLAALFLIMFGRSTVGGGQCMMPPELSRDYPGTVMAVANSIANVAGILGPYLVTQMVANENDYSCWFWFWILSASIFATGGLVFCLFAENAQQNYCRKPKQKLTGSVSLAQLCKPEVGRTTARIPVEETIQMDAFSRIGSEPPTEDVSVKKQA